MKSIMTNNNKAHLSLSKIAESAKADATIFQSLTESLLDGQVAIASRWPDLNAVLIFVTMSKTVLSTILLAYTFIKLRKMAAAIAVHQQYNGAKSLPTTVPSFIYKLNDSRGTDYSLSLELSVLKWDYASFAMLFVTCCLLIAILYKIFTITGTYYLYESYQHTTMCSY